MSNAATDTELAELQQLKQQLAQEMNAVIKAQFKENVRATIQGMLQQNADADAIVGAMESAGYFMQETAGEEAPAPAPPAPPPMAPGAPPPPGAHPYMEAAQRNMGFRCLKKLRPPPSPRLQPRL